MQETLAHHQKPSPVGEGAEPARRMRCPDAKLTSFCQKHTPTDFKICRGSRLISRKLLHFDNVVNFLNFVLCTVELRPSIQAVALFARNDVDMKMRNRLPCALVACIEQIDAIVTAFLYAMTRNLFDCKH